MKEYGVASSWRSSTSLTVASGAGFRKRVSTKWLVGLWQDDESLILDNPSSLAVHRFSDPMPSETLLLKVTKRAKNKNDCDCTSVTLDRAYM